MYLLLYFFRGESKTFVHRNKSAGIERHITVTPRPFGLGQKQQETQLAGDASLLYIELYVELYIDSHSRGAVSWESEAAGLQRRVTR